MGAEHGGVMELVDGDSLTFSPYDESMKEFLVDVRKRFCVITVLGSQGSGKSTLLNLIFSLGFKTSSGVCTKGLNMSKVFVRLPPGQIPEKERDAEVIVLDTEGLVGFDLNRNENYDKKIMLFAFAISNAIIINSSGQLHR
jgi:ABC-type Fe3+/spermidine/putrescine transport system ATPase subunit